MYYNENNGGVAMLMIRVFVWDAVYVGMVMVVKAATVVVAAAKLNIASQGIREMNVVVRVFNAVHHINVRLAGQHKCQRHANYGDCTSEKPVCCHWAPAWRLLTHPNITFTNGGRNSRPMPLPIAAIPALLVRKRRGGTAALLSGTEGLFVLIVFSRLAPRVVAEEVARKAGWRRIPRGLYADFPKAEPDQSVISRCARE